MVVDVHRIMLTSLRAFFMPDFKILAAAFPTHCFCLGNHHCSVSRHGIWQPFFCLYAKQNNDMKNQTSGALIAPEPAGVHVSENLKALNEQVNNLQSRYYRSLAPDCELHGSSDRWYFGAILSACTGFIFPPLFVVTALCVYKAKKCRKGVKNEIQ